MKRHDFGLLWLHSVGLTWPGSGGVGLGWVYLGWDTCEVRLSWNLFSWDKMSGKLG